MFTFFTEQDIQIKYQLPTNSPGEAVEAELIILWTNNLIKPSEIFGVTFTYQTLRWSL